MRLCPHGPGKDGWLDGKGLLEVRRTEGLNHEAIHFVHLPRLTSRAMSSELRLCLMRTTLSCCRCSSCPRLVMPIASRAEPVATGHLSYPKACQVGFVVTAIAQKNYLGICWQAANHTCGVTRVCSFHRRSRVRRMMRTAGPF